ncbi:K(+)-transporting ATPase subunit F [soil metagenome]
MYVAIAVGVAIALLILSLLVIASSRPNIMHVERKTTIKAGPENILPLILDFHRWTAWSPYEKLDPAMKKTYSGAAEGVGAVYQWVGNAKAGEGRMEIIKADPGQVSIKLDFIKPFEGHNIAAFNLTPTGAGTDVVWSMDGPSPFMAKVMGLFINMDAMIGNDFEKGLADMKAAAEG